MIIIERWIFKLAFESRTLSTFSFPQCISASIVIERVEVHIDKHAKAIETI